MGWLCKNCDNSLNFSLLLQLQRVNERERRGVSNKKVGDMEMTLVWERYCSRPALLFHINTVMISSPTILSRHSGLESWIKCRLLYLGAALIGETLQLLILLLIIVILTHIWVWNFIFDLESCSQIILLHGPLTRFFMELSTASSASSVFISRWSLLSCHGVTNLMCHV